MSVRLIMDPGSCHGNSLANIQEMIATAAYCKAELKFQLFKDSPGNLPLDRHLWTNIVSMCKEQGVPVFASVWDSEAVQLLIQTGCKTMKLAFSQRHNHALMEQGRLAGLEIIRSCDYMDNSAYPAVKLFCVPEYPVLHLISFYEVFKKFKGFSDHTLGFKQTEQAIREGAQIIEKHVTTEQNHVPCEDAKFAIKPSEFKRFYDSFIRVPGSDGSEVSEDPCSPRE